MSEVIIKKILVVYKKRDCTYALVETSGVLKYVTLKVFSNQIGGTIFPSTRVSSSRSIHVALMFWLRDIEEYPKSNMIKMAFEMEELFKRTSNPKTPAEMRLDLSCTDISGAGNEVYVKKNKALNGQIRS